MRNGFNTFFLVVLALPVWAFAQSGPTNEEKQEPKQGHSTEQVRAERPVFDPVLSHDGGATLNREFLEIVQDDTLGLVPSDRSAYFHCLKLAQQTPAARLERYAAEFREHRRSLSLRYADQPADKFPAFVDLFHNPDDYRGRPVTLRGVMRSLKKFDPGKNSEGIGDVYEGWVYSDDSRGNPFVVVFINKDDRLPVGGDITEDVSVTGYFLKMYGYEAQDVPRKAPLLLASDVNWKPRPAPHAFKALSFENYLFVTLFVLLLGCLFWQMNWYEMTRPRRPTPEVDFSRFPPREYSATTEETPVIETDDA